MPSPAQPEAGPARHAPQPAAQSAPVRYRVRHTTRYHYDEPVTASHHQVHLIPRAHPRQRIRRCLLSIDPDPTVRDDDEDYFGNPVTFFAVQEPHQSLTITAESDIEVRPPPVIDLAATRPWETLRDWLRMGAQPADAADVDQYAAESTLIAISPELMDFAAPSFPSARPAGLAALDLMERLHRDFVFDPTATTVATPLLEALEKRRGVCQDFAHIMVGCLRTMGLPARYVSGYLRTLPPPGQPRLIGADVSHAWASAWLGDDIWVDFCPSNGRFADQDYVTVAWGRDYQDVSPVRGVIQGAGTHSLSVEVDVEVVEG